MRKTLLLSAALLAVLAGPAMAQRGEHGRGGGGERGGRPPAAAPAAPPASPQPAPAPQAQAAPTNRAEVGRQSMQREQAQRAQFENRGRFAQRNDNNRPDFNRGGNDRRPDLNRGGNDRRPDFNRGGSDNRPDFNRGGNDRRPDFNRGGPGRPGFSTRPSQRNWAQYHRSFNAPHRFSFRGGLYRRPAGWYYRRWTFGDFLPMLFWSSNYWINDYYYYDLPPPPPGTVWVRYGDDALLIDRFSGEIIEVEYGIFF